MDAYNAAVVGPMAAAGLSTVYFKVNESAPIAGVDYSGSTGAPVVNGKSVILYGNQQNAELCGKVTLPAAGSSLAAAGILGAFNGLDSRVDILAQQGNFITNAINASGTGTAPQLSGGYAALQALAAGYDQALQNAVQAALAANPLPATDVIQTSTTNPYGWLGAGAMFITLSRLEDQMLAAAQGMPEIAPPVILMPNDAATHSENWLSSTWDWLTGPSSAQKTAINAGLKSTHEAMSYAKSAITVDQSGGGAPPAYATGAAANASDDTSGGSSVANRIFSYVDISGITAVANLIATSGGPNTSPMLMLQVEGHMLLLLSFAGIAASCLSAAAGAGFSIGPLWGAVGLAIFSPCLMTGILLAFILPFVPLIRFFFAAAHWLLSVAEAVISVPIFALAHLDPDSPGVLPQNARGGYMLLLQLIFRPILIVAGLIIAMVMMNSLVNLWGLLFTATVFNNTGSTTAAANLLSFIGSGFGVISMLVYLILHGVVSYSICNFCLNAVDYVPNSAMRWIGAQGDHHNTEQHASSATAGVMATGQMAQSASNLSGTLKEMEAGKQQGVIDLRFLGTDGQGEGDKSLSAYASARARAQSIRNDRQLTKDTG